MKSHFQSSETTWMSSGAAFAAQRLGRIEIVGADPGDAAEEDDDQRRNRPDDELDPSGVDEVGLPACARVGGAIPPRDAERREDRGNDDREHDHHGIEEDLALGIADGTGRLQLRAAAAGEGEQHQRQQSKADIARCGRDSFSVDGGVSFRQGGDQRRSDFKVPAGLPPRRGQQFPYARQRPTGAEGRT